jgi:hypothetical protein
MNASGSEVTQNPDGTIVGHEGKHIAAMTGPGSHNLVDDHGRPITELPNGTLVDADGHQLTQNSNGTFVGADGKPIFIHDADTNDTFVPPDLRTAASLYLLPEVQAVDVKCLPDGMIFKVKTVSPFRGVVIGRSSQSDKNQCVQDYRKNPDVLPSIYIKHGSCGSMRSRKVGFKQNRTRLFFLARRRRSTGCTCVSTKSTRNTDSKRSGIPCSVRL